MGLTSCSDSWLQTDSTQTAEGDAIFSTTDNAKLVINGICRTMVQQHAYYGQMFNGEGTTVLAENMQDRILTFLICLRMVTDHE